ncbi:MAG: tyrosine-type recombinase/integrase [Thaumarchaeota archaeon]|nr:tyrosine-type recombinase/integrase [Nitrososphaerota archaeon]
MKTVDEIYDYQYTLQNAYKRLDESNISQHDRDIIRKFTYHLSSMGVSKGRLAKYLFHLKNFAEHLGVQIEDAKRADIERFVSWLNSSGYAPHTASDYILAVKRFYKFVRSGNVDKETSWPDEVRWMHKAIKPNERRQPEFFTSIEVETMIKTASTLRDKAMLAVGFEAGLRATELLLLNIGDVTFDDRGARIRVQGKTGERIVRLIASVTLLSQYMQTHSLRAQPDSPLWLTQSTNYRNYRVSWTMWNRRLKYIARQSGITKRVFNHMLRHGSATRNAQFLTDSELKIMYGWAMGSKMPAVYVHLSGKDLDGKLSALYSGRSVEPPKPEFVPAVCPRCSERSSPGMLYCSRCASPLDPKEQSRMSIEDQAVREELKKLRGIVERVLSESEVS